ncbi:ligase-associated DNA damage response exonuclease [Paracoccus sp. CPCC 101403]|uniref:Ligase-associated DNA damage response exonuclease n=1 Tax=Paracoccus broussonetiae TaxID=3075834 RepID=A0ABU3EKT8_9RHOB|nr:ligase-associated DNA damage response exonuclease [Paracoccus sp. CPCC 101403]MDT1064417.1 ligase-associated DNA damage response exonuclease [Paracoccus sp. CPCC 101403]
MRAEDLLFPTKAGLYCPEGDFHIDPLQPVPRALITHAHSDHARMGHGAVMATRETLDIMRLRMGEGFAGTTEIAGAETRIGGVSVGFHPAGHVLGSSQISVTAVNGPRIVVSGDYSRHPNPTCAPFVPVACDVFVTEATFGLPVFNFPDPATEIARLLASMAEFPDRPHLIGAYALGKAQHLIALVRAAGHDAPIAIHGALKTLCDYYQDCGVPLGELIPATADQVPAQLVIAPPSAFASPWVQRFRDPVIGFASGWMAVRARARQRGAELPLVISDHVDWLALTGTLTELSPSEVWVTHGTEDGVIRWCELAQIAARPLRLVGYEDEAE